MLKLLKSNHPFVFIIIPFLTALFWAPAIIFGTHEMVPFDKMVDTPLYSLFMSWLGENYFLHKGIAFLLLISQAYFLIRLNFKYIFIEVKTYLPAVLFVMLASAFPYFQSLHPFLIANIFLLFALERCFEINKDRHQLKQYFETGILLGIGGLFYFPIALFLLLVWVTQFVLRNFSLREWFSSIIGFLTPTLIYLAILYLNDKHQLLFTFFSEMQSMLPSDIEIRGASIYPLLIVGFLILIALLFDISIIGARKIATRKYFILIFWMLAISFFAKLLLPYFSTAMIYAFAVPASLILTMFFVEMRNRWFSEISFFLLFSSIVLSILMQLNVIQF